MFMFEWSNRATWSGTVIWSPQFTPVPIVGYAGPNPVLSPPGFETACAVSVTSSQLLGEVTLEAAEDDHRYQEHDDRHSHHSQVRADVPRRRVRNRQNLDGGMGRDGRVRRLNRVEEALESHHERSNRVREIDPEQMRSRNPEQA